jgi:hypothetical protein
MLKNPVSTDYEPPILAVHMALFPTLGSLKEVVDLANSMLPITSKNEMFSLLMTYHNTLLKTED